MNDSVQSIDVAMLEEQIRKLEKASNHAERNLRVIDKGLKSLRGQEGRQVTYIKNALYEVSTRSENLSNDLSALTNGLVWIENQMKYYDRQAAQKLSGQSGSKNNRSWLEKVIMAIWGFVIDLIGRTDTSSVSPRIGEVKPDNQERVVPMLDKSKDDETTNTIPNVSTDEVEPNQPYIEQVEVSEYLKRCEDDRFKNFRVIKNFKPEYVQVQKWNNNCTTTSEAIAYSIKHDRWTSQFDMEWVSGKGASWRECNRVAGSEDWSAAQKLSKIYEFLCAGEPVIVSCDPTGSRTSPHTVAAIGIRDGANPANLTYADFLVADPADGVVKTLQDLLENSHLTIDRNGWSLKTIK